MLFALLLAPALAEMRAIDPFHGVVNTAPVDVIITIGPDMVLQVNGELDQTQKVVTEVVKGVLVISVAENVRWKPGAVPQVNLTVPSLDQLGAESAGNIRVNGTIEGNDLQLWARAAGDLEVADVTGSTVSLVAEGAGDLRAGVVTGNTVLLASRAGSDVTVVSVLGKSTVYEVNGAGTFSVERHEGKRLEARMAGAGSLRVVGTVDELHVESKGAAQVDLGGLKANRATVAFEGASKGTVYAEKTLEAQVDGASSLMYAGGAKVASSTTGAGVVTALR
jgi:hypothetical protein